MARVITFSKDFPSYHFNDGRPTHFVAKILAQQGINKRASAYVDYLMALNPDRETLAYRFWVDMAAYTTEVALPKSHTIRPGDRFKPGDKFSPRVWTGRPYHSPQIQFLPDMEVKKVWPFQIVDHGVNMARAHFTTDLTQIAHNDGLEVDEFVGWFHGFRKPGEYQIICWNDKIDY